MPTVKVRNLSNKEVGEVSLSDAVFGVELNESLIHSALMNFQANGRQGTSATKTRGNVSGSGRKLWKQKGTGRARIASLRSPLWKGGGNVHGPQPRDWSYKMPKKMRRGASGALCYRGAAVHRQVGSQIHPSSLPPTSRPAVRLDTPTRVLAE